MGTIQGAMNTIIASGATAAAALGKSKDNEEPKKNLTETKTDNPKKEYTKPTLNKPSIGNQEAQKAIQNRYNQDKDFAARMDKAKANTAKRAQQMIDSNKQEFDRLKLEKKKTESIKKLTELKKHKEGGDK